MKHVFLTAAAALLAGTTLAGAQGLNAQTPTGGNKTERAAPAPAAQQQAPAEKIAPMHNAQAPRAGKPAETTGQAQQEPAGKADMKGNATTKMNDDKGGKSALDTKTKMDEKNKMSADDKSKAGAADKNGTNARVDEKNKSTAQDNKQGTKQESKTTGQGAASSRSVNLSTEQRTKIRTVIKEKVHVQPLTHVNFTISIGTRVPREVHYYPLPEEVVTIYPQWRGYDFVMVDNEILVIDPATFEIVEIIT